MFARISTFIKFYYYTHVYFFVYLYMYCLYRMLSKGKEQISDIGSETWYLRVPAYDPLVSTSVDIALFLTIYSLIKVVIFS